MAVVRPARSSLPYGLIIFVFLWLVSTGVAVFFYMQKATAQEKLDEFNNQYVKNIIRRDEVRSDSVTSLVAAGAKESHTAMGQAIKNIEKLKTLIDASSGSNMSLDALTAKAEKARADVNQKDTPSLLDAMNNTYAALSKEKARADKLTGELQQAKDQYDVAKKAYDTAVAANTKVIEERRNEIGTLNGDITKLRGDNDASVKKYEDEKTALRGDLEKAQRELVVKLQQAKEDADGFKKEIARLKSQIEMLRPSVKSTVALEPDGRILRATPSSGEVYISLGRKDRVTPGLTFAVYDPKMGVGSNEGKGKGALEVVDVMENESLCRITNTEKNVRFEVNDLIANTIYNKDKNRKFHFVVYGDFDLDGDGVATPGERDKVLRMIQTWGGVVDETMDSQTDFLVVGAMPATASSKLSTEAEKNSELAQQRKAKQDEYNKLLSQAKDYSIPVLNANRFLAMIGYYNTTITRY